jgi:hypothetical protein
MQIARRAADDERAQTSGELVEQVGGRGETEQGFLCRRAHGIGP